MDFHFGPFVSYLIYTFYFWYISLPIGFLLLLACLRRKNGRGIRWISGIGAALLLFPFVVFSWDLIGGTISNRKINREQKQRKKQNTFILKHPEIVAGIALSAGDTVYYAIYFDMNNRQQAQLTDLDSVHLSKPTRFFYLLVKECIKVNEYGEWYVTLSGDQLVFGWPCTGDVAIATDSTFASGTLSAEHVVWGYRLPERTKVIYRKNEGLLRITLPGLKLITIYEETKQPLLEEDSMLLKSFRVKGGSE